MPVSTLKSRRPIGTLLLAFVFIGLGAISAAMLVNPPTPTLLDSRTGPGFAPVVQSKFSDPRPADVGLVVSEEQTVQTIIPGRLTSWNCSTTAPWESGEVFAAVDGVPLLALATAVPLWRNLSVGDAGPDVAALQSELVRLGSLTAATPTLTQADLDAISSLTDDPTPATEVDFARVLWLPSPTVTPSLCSAQLGKILSQGENLAVLGSRVTSASIALDSEELMPGARKLVIDGDSVNLPDFNSTISDSAVLDFISGRIQYPSDDKGSAQLPAAQIELQEAVLVYAIPASAIFAVRQQTGCVTDGSRIARVRIDGSRLGQTFVSFQDAPVENVEISPEDVSKCG